MRIDEEGAGYVIGRHIAEANGFEFNPGDTWTGTSGPDLEVNGIYFTLYQPVEHNYLIPMTGKQYWAYVKEAGIED